MFYVENTGWAWKRWYWESMLDSNGGFIMGKNIWGKKIDHLVAYSLRDVVSDKS